MRRAADTNQMLSDVDGFSGSSAKPLSNRLEKLQDVAEQRLDEYQHCAHEFRLDKNDAVSTCNSENERVDALIDSWRASK